METQEPQSAGDYGYDLAHEERGGAKAPDPRPAEQPRRPASGGRPDPDDDYGYDEAHSF
jgi:hypothetical protein